jgi:hypothetical protein
VKILIDEREAQKYKHLVWVNNWSDHRTPLRSGYIVSDNLSEIIKYLHLSGDLFHHYYQHAKVIVSCTGVPDERYRSVAREDFITELLKYADPEGGDKC